MAGLGWTRCHECSRLVLVTQSRLYGVHWREVGRRCATSTTLVPKDQRVATSQAELTKEKR
jgi:hypothetical protein